VPHMPDTVWSADFMTDALYNSRSFRTFNVVDDFNREALHIEIDTSITSERLVRIFQRLQAERDAVDPGSGQIGKARGLDRVGVGLQRDHVIGDLAAAGIVKVSQFHRGALGSKKCRLVAVHLVS